MFSPIVGAVVLLVYSTLLAVGGTIGYVKAGSRASLIAGSISSSIAALAGALAIGGFYGIGFGLGLILATCLIFMFITRYARTRKFMPSGMLAVMSLVVAGIMLTLVVSARA